MKGVAPASRSSRLARIGRLAVAAVPLWFSPGSILSAPRAANPTRAMSGWIGALDADSGAPPHDTVATPPAADAVSQALIQSLQPIRPIDVPSPVADVVRARAMSGASAMVPVTAVLGWGDFRLYGIQLKSVFPMSQDVYPDDSLRIRKHDRAAAWVDRLDALSAAEQGYAVRGWQRVPLAALAVSAGRDSAARRWFDTRIAELASRPAERSYSLWAAVGAFVDGEQDSTRLVRHMQIAEQYNKTLQVIPLSGYATRHDSVSALYWHWQSEQALVDAFATLHDTVGVVRHMQREWGYTTILGVHERGAPLFGAMDRVIPDFEQTEWGRQFILHLATPWLDAARRAGTNFAPSVPLEERTRVAHILVAGVQSRIGAITERFALLGMAAPPITAHLWLNTPDSLYAPLPRARSFVDGNVHVLCFASYDDNARLSTLDRLQRTVPSDVRVLVVTTTNGSQGPDVFSPEDEARWLTHFLIGIRHYTLPIAIWAGRKVATGFVPEGHATATEPEETPNEAPYHPFGLLGSCAVIGRGGTIRALHNIESRDDEAALRTLIQHARTELAPSASAMTSEVTRAAVPTTHPASAPPSR